MSKLKLKYKLTCRVYTKPYLAVLKRELHYAVTDWDGHLVDAALYDSFKNVMGAFRALH